MNFEPSSLIMFITVLVWLVGVIFTIRSKSWKSLGLLLFVGLVLTIFNPFSYNNNSGGYGSIERFEKQSPTMDELPERFTVEPVLPFEERINRDIQNLKEERSE